MGKFERIKVDKGQPYIRDTGISISTLAGLMLENATPETVLATYPNLEKEDLLEVIGYIADDLLETVAYARSDGLSPISSIYNAAKILLDPQNRTDEILSNGLDLTVATATEAAFVWYQLSYWAQFSYQGVKQNFDKVTISSIVNGLKHSLSYFKLDEHVSFSVLENDLKIKGEFNFLTAVENILVESHYSLKVGGSVKFSLKDETTITVHVQRERKTILSNAPAEFYILRHSQIALAERIVQSFGSELKIYPSTATVAFEFDLPIWHENT